MTLTWDPPTSIVRMFFVDIRLFVRFLMIATPEPRADSSSAKILRNFSWRENWVQPSPPRAYLVALPGQTYEFSEQLPQRSFERPSRLLGSPSQTIGPRSLSSNGRPRSFVGLVRSLKILRYREIIERIFDIRRDGQWSD
jgi:hypothetical protein